MNDENVNNELDNLFRDELENLPEEKPDARDWQQMSYRLQAEGLNGHSSNGRKYFLLVLLFVLLSGLVSIPFLMPDKNENQNVKKEAENPLTTGANKNSSNENITHETGQAGITEKAITNSESGSENESSYQSSGKSSATASLLSRYENDNKAQKNSLAEEGTDTAPRAQQKTELTSADENSSGAQIENNAAEEQALASDIQNAVSTQAGNADVKNISETAISTHMEDVSANLPAVDSASLADNKTTNSDASTAGRFRLGIYASLDYNFYAIKENSNVAQAEADFVRQSDLIKGEKWSGQYTIGIIGGYLFTQKLSIEGGVFYSQKKKLHADIYTPSYSDSEQETFSDFTYDYKARYFELYGRAKYYFHRKKNSLYATLGAAGSYNLPAGGDSSDYFLRTSYNESSPGETDHVALDASSAGLALVVSAGIEIPIGSRWDAYIEPAYRYSFYPVIKHPTYDRVPIEHFLRSISLATGLMYKF